MDVNFFGRLGETIGRRVAVRVPDGGCSISELRSMLVEAHPEAEADLVNPALRACVEDRIVSEDHRVKEGEEVEFFPPLSGG
jgi:molybdopterin converting factor small subunit